MLITTSDFQEGDSSCWMEVTIRWAGHTRETAVAPEDLRVVLGVKAKPGLVLLNLLETCALLWAPAGGEGCVLGGV